MKPAENTLSSSTFAINFHYGANYRTLLLEASFIEIIVTTSCNKATFENFTGRFVLESFFS